MTSTRLRNLEDVAHAASNLEEFLGSNLGTNADWPIKLVCDNEVTALQLRRKLDMLQHALQAVRQTSI